MVDQKRLDLYVSMSNKTISINSNFGNNLYSIQLEKLHNFMSATFAKRRILIIRHNRSKKKILKKLKDYCKEKGIGLCELDAQNMVVDDIKGEWEITYDNGNPYSSRKTPYYVNDGKQMNVVDYLTAEVDIELFRAFAYMAGLGVYCNYVENFPKERLPYGSAYIFITEEDLVHKRFLSLSPSLSDEIAILDLRDFHTKVKEHLEKYKKEKLNISKPGLFSYKGRKFEHDHILPLDTIESNIIEKYRNDFYASMYSCDIAFHRYFHHLNSSQAMCINFFYPLIKEKLLDRIISILALKGDINYNPNDICFEKESKVEESSTRKTNFDFYIKLDTGIKLYFEIKYCEKGFGKGEKTDERRQKFRGTYWSILKEHPAIKASYKTEDVFLDNYQIMRNLLHINQESYVIFIYPNENLNIKREALSAIKNIIESGWENHLILLTWEDLVEKISSHSLHKELIDYYMEFKSKYLKY